MVARHIYKCSPSTKHGMGGQERGDDCIHVHLHLGAGEGGGGYGDGRYNC